MLTILIRWLALLIFYPSRRARVPSFDLTELVKKTFEGKIISTFDNPLLKPAQCLTRTAPVPSSIGTPFA